MRLLVKENGEGGTEAVRVDADAGALAEPLQQAIHTVALHRAMAALAGPQVAVTVYAELEGFRRPFSEHEEPFLLSLAAHADQLPVEVYSIQPERGDLVQP